ncbi:ATP-binding protein [Lactiplantibacillus paraplantarum]|uniref:ATP-binding protein n=1 Tax=Lactiplantibacillus paraplantarum TaxID=60520 RepID=UPI003DA5DD4F
MEFKELQKWLGKVEDDHHDFKEHWYHHGQKPEMVKDIFSFVNTIHHDDCFLIVGVSDDRRITGVENDGDNRLNQQKLIDFVRSLPISGEFIPKLQVETIFCGEHEVDVIRIFNTNNIPVYLGNRWNEKGLPKNGINPGQIFAREQDVNTARDSTATYSQVEALWKKHFRMDVPIEERYLYNLSDTDSWTYSETDGAVFRYNLDPDFYMELIEDDTKRFQAEAYSLDQVRTKMYWRLLNLKYRQNTIHQLLVVWLDGSRFLVVTPKFGFVKKAKEESLAYYYLTENSFEGKVQKLFETGLPLKADSGSMCNFYKGVVFYQSGEEKESVELELDAQFNTVNRWITPTKEEISSYQGIMMSDFSPDDHEIASGNVEYMLRQHKLGEIANLFLNAYRNNEATPNLG